MESELGSTASILICMRTHKAHAARWPLSKHLPSGCLPQAFKRAHPKWIPQYCNYKLPDHLYISPRISVVLLHYDTADMGKTWVLSGPLSFGGETVRNTLAQCMLSTNNVSNGMKDYTDTDSDGKAEIIYGHCN